MLGLFHELSLCGYFLKQHNNTIKIQLKCENSKLSNRDIVMKMGSELGNGTVPEDVHVLSD